MKHRTTFKDWILAYGIPKLAKECNVTPRTVYYWIGTKGRRVRPKSEACEKILQLAPHLTLGDILGIHRMVG